MEHCSDSPETKSVEKQHAPSLSSNPELDEVKWLPLQNHPVFSSTTASCASVNSSTFRMPTNFLAWDGSSRLYFWDPDKQCLHRISIRLGDPDPSSVLAASPSKVLRADVRLKFVVSKVSINRNGSALLLAGPDGLSVVYLYGCTSTIDGSGPSICRTVSIGSQIYSSGDNVIQTLQMSWHPCSDTHMGILSSDSVFRIFDISSALEQPEQEYYLQPVEPGRCRNAASICPVDFSFGSDHLWDRFSVFVLFSDGSVYILCPVVPFGSLHNWESILEIYHDAQTFAGGILSVVKAQPYALFDASISLQGPLPKVGHGGEEDTHVQVERCEGRAVSLLYNAISKDSILVTAWSGGQLQIDALADEIQPVWIFGNPPRVCVNSHDCIVRVAMICESVTGDPSSVKLYEPSDHDVWSGYPPPLLRLGIVDLALPRNRESTSLVSMVVDRLIPERIFTLHDGVIDSIVLHFLPFTNQKSGKNESMRTPSVHPVLCTSQGGSSSPLIGFLVLSDSYGYSWIVGLTSSRECIVLEMKTLGPLPPIHVEREEVATLDESRANDNRVIISEELLSGPKAVLLPPSTLDESRANDNRVIISEELLSGPKAVLLPPSNLRPVTADSIEGQSTLHHYFKLFHENYVEYAHKVYIELKHHGPLLKEIIEDQHGRLLGAQQKLLKVEEKQEKLEDRITHATQVHSLLKERLQRLRNLPGVREKPLSKAEREFKSELDRFTGVELDALHSSIEALNARLRRYAHSLQGNPSNQRRQISGRRKNYVQDDHISLLKSSLAKLSLVNSENIKKVKTMISVLGDPKPSASIGVAMSNAFMPVVSDDRLQAVVDEEESHPSQVDASPRGVTPSDCEENDVLYSEVHVTPTRVIPAFAEHTPLSIDQQARHPPPVPSVSCRVVTESAALRNEGFDDFASITQSSGQQDPGEPLSSHLQSEIQDEEDQGEDASEDMPHSKVIAGVCVGVEYYPILEEIERRFPDVFSNLFSVTTWLTYGILISFASFMKEVRYTRVDDLDASKIKTFLVALKEFEQMGLDVSWIRPRFEEVQRLNHLRMFAQDLEVSKAFVIERERELTELKADVARREGKLANAKRVAPTSLVDGDLVLKDIF
ncbi:hypothetical protein Vadar_003240 [Vaccinium darrowii]|uniref:Uncharacterized protein n=1 Tax=Vaccinium darrowii TaxID=229202 RepID=A0ACB7XFF3_9ERIC|nr:hypothetical protein Vadar_003240 [Vaccinium darrowii]